MQSLFKFLFLQSFWYLVVGQKLNLGFTCILMVLMLIYHYFTLNHKCRIKIFIIHIFSFLLTGVFFDSGLFILEIIQRKSYHLDLLLLWPAFYIYYDMGILRFEGQKKYIQFLLGALGGLFTYYMGVKMEGFKLISPSLFYLYVGLFWGVFFIASLSFVKKTIYKS